MDHFARLGLPRAFAVDPAELERRYLDESRAAHPDHGGALADSAAVNEAYLALKDPLRRAEHLLALLGDPAAAGDKNLDQSFLMEMMELRESIEDAGRDAAALAAAEANLRGRERVLFDAVAARLASGDSAAARRGLNGVRTVRSLLRDVREKLDDAGA